MATFSPDEFAKKLQEASQVVLNSLPDIMDNNANDAKALIRDRVTQKGLMVTGSGEEVAFPAYSDAYEKKKAREGKSGAGTPNRLVYTGDMLRKTQIVNRIKTDKSYTVVLGGTDAFSDDKLSYNTDRYGDVLRLSKNEEKIISEVTSEEIINAFIKALE